MNKINTSVRKILVLNPYLPTLGGGEKQMGFLCSFFEKKYPMAIVDILVFNYNEVDVNSEKYVSIDDLNKKFRLDLHRTHIYKLDLNCSNSLFSKLRNKKRIEDITTEYDIFVNHMFMSKHAGFAKFNVYMCMFPPTRFSVFYTGIKKFFGKYLDRKFYTSYDVFVPLSKFTEYWQNNSWPVAEKSKLIYSPVFHEEELSGRYCHAAKKNIILSVGRFFLSAHSKKQYEMVKMFLENERILNGASYHVIGSVSNNVEDIQYLNSVLELAKKSNNIYVHVNSSYDELNELYKSAKVFWHATGCDVDEEKFPEKMEHFGITTVEAMSFGVVPVVIQKGGQKEIVEHGKSGFLWLSKDDCIAYTSKILKDDELFSILAENAVMRAKFFSVEEFYRSNERIYGGVFS